MSTGWRTPSRRRAAGQLLAAAVLAAGLALAGSPAEAVVGTPRPLPQTAAAGPVPTLTKISSDPYTAPGGQHATEVEPAVAAAGSTVVATFQGDRNAGNGSVNIGWATSDDRGTTWTNGWLPGLTTVAGGPYPRAADSVVAHDAATGTWLIASVGIVASGSGFTEGGIAVSRSSNGRNWTDAVTVVTANTPDKSWITCDNNTSPYRGTCYLFWSANDEGYLVYAATSTDGGVSWSDPALTTRRGLGYYDVQPVVQPSGTIVVVATSLTDSSIVSFRSVDGGVTWSDPALVSVVDHHKPVGGLREKPKPTVGVSPAGVVYTAWSDCRFHPGCGSNDILLSSSVDGLTWSPPSLVDISDGVGGDYFLPGLAADPDSGRLGLVYYYYSVAACGSTCSLNVAFVDSSDGGVSWSQPQRLTKQGMSLSWLPKAINGRMVGDYFAPAYAGGNLVPVFAVAAPLRATTPRFNQAMYAAVLGPNTVYTGAATVSEGASGTSSVSVPVWLGSVQPTDVVVSFATSNGSARAGQDYRKAVGSVTIPAGSTTGGISVPILGDTTPEGNEVFYLTLLSATNVTVAHRTGWITITNDD